MAAVLWWCCGSAVVVLILRFTTAGNLNFITGAGGYLQNYINGYAGLRCVRKY